jgi:shikimate 5-dehydrogenase
VTLHDVLVVCDEEKDEKLGRAGIHAGYVKEGMIVLDLTAGIKGTPLMRAAHDRGCDIVDSLELTLDLLELQARTLTGKPVPRDVLRNAIPQRFLEDEEE